MKKSFLQKVSTLFILGALLLLADACINCNCPTVINKHFDFKELVFSTNLDSIPAGENFHFDIMPDEIEFVVENTTNTCRRPWFVSTAMACSCPTEGDLGLKEGTILSLNVFSNAALTEDLPAGTSLNDHVILTHPRTGTNVSISETVELEETFSMYSATSMFLDQMPTVDSTHIFTFELIKSSGDTILVNSGNIVFL